MWAEQVLPLTQESTTGAAGEGGNDHHLPLGSTGPLTWLSSPGKAYLEKAREQEPLDGKDEKRQESLEPCPKLLRPLYLFHKHCVVLEPAHRAAESLNEMASIGQKLLFPPILPSEAQPRLVRVYWRAREPY